jgi:Yip1 domain
MDIVARARGLITRPREEWGIIAGEPADTASLFKGYVMPMAAIPVVASFTGLALFARMFAGMLPGFSIGALLVQSIVSYILGLAGVWVFGKIVQILAPRFGGTGEEVAAMKLAAYSPTASWLAGVFAILPPLAILALLGLYSLYILYKGVPVVTRVPHDKALVLTLALIVCGLAMYLLIGLVASPLLLAG